MSPRRSYQIERVSAKDVARLFEDYHAYGGMSKSQTYLWAVIEDGRPVAAYSWQPPPYGCARSVLPDAPWGVLSLSRMVAVPRSERALNHISKPLRHQMKSLIDRTRWPALVTFSDEGLQHRGHVYRCSGWQQTTRSERAQWVDANGRRTSTYRNGKHRMEGLTCIGRNYIQRWEHHIVPPGEAAEHMREHGWNRVPIPGKVWRSGKPAHHIVQTPQEPTVGGET